MAKSEPRASLEKAGKLHPSWCLHLGRASDQSVPFTRGKFCHCKLLAAGAWRQPAKRPTGLPVLPLILSEIWKIWPLTVWLLVAGNFPDLEGVTAWQSGDPRPNSGPCTVTLRPVDALIPVWIALLEPVSSPT